LTTGAVAGAGPRGVPFLTLRCVHAQKRPRPSWLVSVLRPRFSCSDPVVVSLVTNLTLCQIDPFRRHHAAHVRLRSARLDSTLLSIWSLTGNRLACSTPTCSKEHSATSTGVEEQLSRPTTTFVSCGTALRSSGLTRDDSACAATAFDALRSSSRISRSLRDGSRSNLSFRRRASPVQVPPTADRVL
jgi:hypothetical protein